MNIITPIPQIHLARAAVLYWNAFGQKLGTVLGPEDKALTFIQNVQRPDHALCAVDDDGRLLGVVGFKTHQGALVAGTFRDLARVYGTLGAIWRSLLFGALEQDTENKRFLMDGLFVAPDARGKGVGTALLNAICREAQKRGYAEIRLEVIDTNTRARDLYVRSGFIPIQKNDIGVLRHVFGFRSTTTMVRDARL